MLDDNNANEVGECGTSDAEGEGYDCVVSFKDGMKEVELERLCFDANEIESGIEVDDNDAFVCEVKDNSSNSSLYGAYYYLRTANHTASHSFHIGIW